MSSETSITTLAPARHGALLSRPLRQERCDAARWALGAGRPLNLGAVTVILAVRSFESSRDRKPFHRWTSHDITSFVWGSAVGWCNANGIQVPADLAESMWSYLAFVSETGRLVSGSSRPEELLGVVRSCRTHPGRASFALAASPSRRRGPCPAPDSRSRLMR